MELINPTPSPEYQTFDFDFEFDFEFDFDFDFDFDFGYQNLGVGVGILLGILLENPQFLDTQCVLHCVLQNYSCQSVCLSVRLSVNTKFLYFVPYDFSDALQQLPS